MHRRTVLRFAPTARSAAALALAGLSLAACATGPKYDHRAGGGTTTLQPRADANRYKVGKPYQVKGVWYTPAEQPGYDRTGTGSWYGEQFHNRYTANGEVFDMDLKTAAHTTLPLPSLVEVTNLDNGRKLVVRVNDRGPFIDNRVIDLSRAAARELGYENQGLARVRVRYIGPAPLIGTGARTYQASLQPPVQAPPRTPRTVERAFAQPQRPIQYATVQAAPPAYTQGKPDFLPGGPIPTPGVNLPTPPLSPPPVTGGAFRIQAGAFADRARAEQAVQALSEAGRPEIIPVERNGSVLYRVQVTGEGQAWAVRDRVASLGYSDAKVLEGF